MPPRVVFATYAHQPAITADDEVLRDALSARHIDVGAAAWDDPSMDWSTTNLCVIRSTWDYHRRHSEFLDWAHRVSTVTSLWNPFPVVQGNSHKRYLRDLAAHGVATVPTRWLNAGSHVDLAAVLARSGWSAAIMKPAVGANSDGVALATRERITQAQVHLEGLLRQGDVMVQLYLPSVRSRGERSLILIDGVVTHAWRRSSPLDDRDEDVTVVRPAPDEVALAHAALGATGGPILYARVDILHDAAGRPLLSELELIEPFLALRLAPGAAARLADVIARIVRVKADERGMQTHDFGRVAR
ncbi:MAG: hypothetical protein PVSMB7_11040 [Chloroflexota bacterium]